MLQISDEHIEDNVDFKRKKKSPNFIYKLFKRNKSLIEKGCVTIENNFRVNMDKKDSTGKPKSKKY